MRGKKGVPVSEVLLELSIPEPNSGCLIWLGTVSKTSGYGSFAMPDRTRTSAHKAAYLTWCGPVADGLEVCHSCNNKLCIEPSHLYLDTRSGNAEYVVDCGRTTKKKKHDLPWGVYYHRRCPKHPYQSAFILRGRKFYNGYFASPEEAHKVSMDTRKAAKLELEATI